MAVVGLVRTAAEVLPVATRVKKAVVVAAGFVLSYYFQFDALGLFGLKIDPSAWQAHTVWMILNSTVIALATFVGHDGLDRLAGK